MKELLVALAITGLVAALLLAVCAPALRFGQAGYHVFSCSMPGHAAAGMTGAVFVQR